MESCVLAGEECSNNRVSVLRECSRNLSTCRRGVKQWQHQCGGEVRWKVMCLLQCFGGTESDVSWKSSCKCTGKLCAYRRRGVEWRQQWRHVGPGPLHHRGPETAVGKGERLLCTVTLGFLSLVAKERRDHGTCVTKMSGVVKVLCPFSGD